MSVKPLWILTAGCAPLAVLTVMSFAELATVERQLPTAGFKSRALADDFSTAAVARQVAGDLPVCKAMAGGRFWEGDSLVPPADAPSPERLSTCAEHWDAWRRAYELVDNILSAEHGGRSGDVEQLRQTVNRLAELKRTAQKEAPLGVARLLRTLDRRSSELAGDIRRLEQRKEAMVILGKARVAFQENRFDECLLLCDQLLGTYADALDEADLARLRVLRGRAVFWNDAGRLAADLKKAESPSRKQSLLAAFLGTYADQRDSTASQRGLLDDCRRRLAALEAALLEAERNRAARQPLDALRTDPPETFAQRLARAVAILDRYPTPQVRAELRALVPGWVEAFVPPEPLEEPPELEEVETSDGRLLRGFFERVPRQGEPLIGYKRYATKEERQNPRVNAGTYRADQLRGVPGPTLPRQCLNRYEEARRRVLAHPQQRQAWEQLAATCEAIEAELRIYHAKAGSGSKSFSLARQGQFAREVLRQTTWAELETLFGE